MVIQFALMCMPSEPNHFQKIHILQKRNRFHDRPSWIMKNAKNNIKESIRTYYLTIIRGIHGYWFLSTLLQVSSRQTLVIEEWQRRVCSTYVTDEICPSDNLIQIFLHGRMQLILLCRSKTGTVSLHDRFWTES